MRIPAAVPFLLAAFAAAPAGPALAADDPAKLRDQVLDGALMEASRLKSALALEKADPELLGGALVDIGEKQKNPGNLPFLVAFTVKEEARHLRFVATYAAWMSAPDRAAGAYLEKAASEDEKEAARAVEAAGFVAAAEKDKGGWTKYMESAAKLLEVAKGARTIPGIEAARALNRAMDKRLESDLADAACAAADNHVRKHLVWAVMDIAGSDRAATKTFEGMRGRPGDVGKNANECASILGDKQATPFTWRPDALKDAGKWWHSGRPKDLEPEPTMKDEANKTKIAGWIASMKKEAPPWGSYVCSSLHRISYRADKGFEIFDMKKKALMLDSSEIARCESPFQGSYVLARGAGIAFCAQMGEPSRDHRGWEPAYVDLHSFMKDMHQTVGKLQDFVDEAIAKHPWP